MCHDQDSDIRWNNPKTKIGGEEHDITISSEDELKERIKQFYEAAGHEVENVEIMSDGNHRIFLVGGEIIETETHNTPCSTTKKGIIIQIGGPNFPDGHKGRHNDELFYHRPLEDVLAGMFGEDPTTGYGGRIRDICVVSPDQGSHPPNIEKFLFPEGEKHIPPHLAGPAPYIVLLNNAGGGHCPFCNTFNPTAFDELRCTNCQALFRRPTVALRWANTDPLGLTKLRDK